MTRDQKQDLANKIINTSNKKHLKQSDIDGLLESYIVNHASNEESIYLAKHGFSIIEIMESIILDRKNVKKTTMNKITESSKSDFMVIYGKDLAEARKNIESLRKMMPQLPESFYAEWDEDPKDPLRNCDEDICDYITKVSMLANEPINYDELYNIVDKNFYKNSTERQMIFDNIKAFKNYIKNYMTSHDLLGDIDNQYLNESSKKIKESFEDDDNYDEYDEEVHEEADDFSSSHAFDGDDYDGEGDIKGTLDKIAKIILCLSDEVLGVLEDLSPMGLDNNRDVLDDFDNSEIGKTLNDLWGKDESEDYLQNFIVSLYGKYHQELPEDIKNHFII